MINRLEQRVLDVLHFVGWLTFGESIAHAREWRRRIPRYGLALKRPRGYINNGEIGVHKCATIIQQGFGGVPSGTIRCDKPVS